MSEEKAPTRENLIAIADGAAQERSRQPRGPRKATHKQFVDERSQLKEAIGDSFIQEADFIIDSAIVKLADAAKKPQKTPAGRVVIVEVSFAEGYSAGHYTLGEKLRGEYETGTVIGAVKSQAKKRSTKEMNIVMIREVDGDETTGYYSTKYCVVVTINLDK